MIGIGLIATPRAKGRISPMTAPMRRSRQLLPFVTSIGPVSRLSSGRILPDSRCQSFSRQPTCGVSASIAARFVA
ncbi:hypothetical protein GCM10009776_17900 [Microbacterium deminutum]|uniref:Uncharacterized protein n=2 Tax=Microbacterium deminutum TaxID=344164 RepID=A0ABN2QSI0_9MICO